MAQFEETSGGHRALDPLSEQVAAKIRPHYDADCTLNSTTETLLLLT